jgi:SulP family sulfate permease
MNNLSQKLKRYFRGKFQADLNAGLTVSMVVIPQAMAYSAIAGINPIYGLFTAILPTIIAALTSSFPFLITGPTNPTALVTASVLIVYANRPDYFEFVVALAIIAGVFKILFGVLKLGHLSRYISNSVLVGFLSAVGVLIIGSQIGNLFGFDLSSQGGLFGIMTQIIENISDLNPYTTFVSLISVGLMILIRKVNRKLPAALFTIIIATLFVMLTGWLGEQGVRPVELPSQTAFGFHIPKISFSDVITLGVSGAAVALFGIMETVTVAKSMSQMTGGEFDPSKEMVSQGLASFVGGFFQCMPSAASPSRTVINVVNGAKTKMAAIISGIGVGIFLLLFAGLIGYIPSAALAAVVIISSAGLINPNLIKTTWHSGNKSRVAMIVTFLSTLFLPLEYAIYLGILTTILIYLGESSHINLSYIVETDDGDFIELPLEEILKEDPKIAIINIEGDLYFAAVEDLQTRVNEILESGVKVMILRFRRTHLLASTGLMALDRLIQSARDKNVRVLFCGLQKEVLEPLEAAGMTEILGESQIFHAQSRLYQSTQQALKAAKNILGKQAQDERNKEKQA